MTESATTRNAHVGPHYSHTIPSDSLLNYPGWVGCLDTDSGEDWLAVGCGVGLVSLWYLADLKVPAVFPTPAAPQACLFAGGEVNHSALLPSSSYLSPQVVSAGAESHLSKWSLDGKLQRRLETSSRHIYSLSSDRHPHSPSFFASGIGSTVDFFSPLGIRSFSLLFPSS